MIGQWTIFGLGIVFGMISFLVFDNLKFKRALYKIRKQERQELERTQQGDPE